MPMVILFSFNYVIFEAINGFHSFIHSFIYTASCAAVDRISDIVRRAVPLR